MSKNTAAGGGDVHGAVGNVVLEAKGGPGRKCLGLFWFGVGEGRRFLCAWEARGSYCIIN